MKNLFLVSLIVLASIFGYAKVSYAPAAIGYTLNAAPVGTDQLLMLDDPAGTWSVNRVAMSVLWDLYKEDINTAVKLESVANLGAFFNEYADDADAATMLGTLGLSATASEINTPLDGASVLLAEFQQLETIGTTTISANQWTVIGGLAETLTFGEVNVLDGITAGTAAASKALVLDASSDIATINSLTATTLVGALTGNASTATLAATVTIADNESTAETNAVVFLPGGDLDGGNLALESDGTFHYNPSTGTATASKFAAATGEFGTMEVSASLVPSGAIDIGSTSAEWDDLFLNDGGKIQLGLDQDVTLTHVADTGVLLAGTTDEQLQIGDSGTFLNQSTDGTLNIAGDTLVEITTPNLRLEVDDLAYLNIATADGGITTISQTSDGTDEIKLGDSADLISVDSGNWDVSNAGAFTGVTGIVSTGAIDFGGATTFEIPNTAGDVALGVAGQVALDLTNDQLAFHGGASGEIQGEAALSLLKHASLTFDPAAYYDQESTYRVLPLFKVGDDAPNGITITEWRVNYVGGDPDTELDADIMCDTDPDFNPADNSTVMDVINTTAGASTADTGFDSASCANASNVYIRFGADPADANEVIAFDLWFYAEED